MKSYLKTDSIEVLGETLELRELSARAQIELLELHRAGKEDQTSALVAKHGVVAWAQESIEDIERNVPTKELNQIAIAVYAISGITVKATAADDAADTKKNAPLSASAMNGASSSDSPLN